MTLTEDSARLIAEQFQHEAPDDRYKQSRTVSRRELVASLYDAIMERRKAGFSFEGIVAHLERLGAPMSVSTLKSYLIDAKRRARAAQPTGSRREPKTQRRTQPRNTGRADTPRNHAGEATAEGSRERKPTDSSTTSGGDLAATTNIATAEHLRDDVSISRNTESASPEAAHHASHDAVAHPAVDSDAADQREETPRAATNGAAGGATEGRDNAPLADVQRRLLEVNQRTDQASPRDPECHVSTANSNGASVADGVPPRRRAYNSTIIIRPEKPLSDFKEHS